MAQQGMYSRIFETHAPSARFLPLRLSCKRGPETNRNQRMHPDWGLGAEVGGKGKKDTHEEAPRACFPVVASWTMLMG